MPAAMLACIAALVPADAAKAARQLSVGFADGLFADRDAVTRALWQDRARDAGASLIRVNVPWRGYVAGPPADPRDPADHAYDFAALDATVRDLDARGFDVLFTVYSAPDWAEGGKREGSASAGTWKPDPAAYADFAAALARRYSGSYDPGSGALPQVGYMQAWNEPNLTRYLNPQWRDGQNFAAERYRELLNAFYEAVKAVSPTTRVVTAGTGPYGEPPGGTRTRPLRFWREVLCLRNRRALRPARCVKRERRAHFDILSHHPINTSGGPRKSAQHPDDVTGADFKQIRRTLAAAERSGRALPKGGHPLWATEFWWESDPPDGFNGSPPRTQAKRIAETLYLLWRQGAEAAILLQIRDDAYDPKAPNATLQSGLYYLDGKAKPALRATRFPFVADRRSRRKVIAWGIAPAGGKLRIERRKGKRWREVKTLRGRDRRVFKAKLRLRGEAKLRARVRGMKAPAQRLAASG